MTTTRSSLTGSTVAADPADTALNLSDDKRRGRRVHSMITVRLLTADSDEVLHCEADEVGERGMHLRAPVGFGIRAGQEYEVVFDDPHALPEFEHISGERRRASVVRTELKLDACPHSVAVALEFDNPMPF